MTTSPPLSLPDDDHDAGDVFRGTIPPAERDGYVPTPAITQFQCYKYDDENDVIKDKFSFFRSCAKCYEASGNMPDVLFSMAIGTLKNYEKIMEEPPFSKTRKKAHTSAFQPCLKRLVQEVLRRSHFFIAEYKVEDERHPLWNHRYKKAVVPRPSQWIRAALIDWLKSNILPARIEDDEFLESEVTRFSQNLARALEEEERDKVAAAAAAAGSQSGAPFCKARTGRSSVVPNRETDQYAAAGSQSESGAQIWKATTGWSCVVPNLRLIQIVLRPELLAHYETGDRTQQERTTHGARGTQQEVMSFWERVMLLFNNKDFKLDSSPIDSSWGGRFFIEPIQLNWEQLDEVGVTSLETPFAAKQKYTLLTNQLGNVYHKWKRSGSGQVRVDDEAIADQLNEDAASPPCEVEVQRNLMLSGGDRFRFLGDFNPAIMYLWYMLEKQRELFWILWEKSIRLTLLMDQWVHQHLVHREANQTKLLLPSLNKEQIRSLQF